MIFRAALMFCNFVKIALKNITSRFILYYKWILRFYAGAASIKAIFYS